MNVATSMAPFYKLPIFYSLLNKQFQRPKPPTAGLSIQLQEEWTAFTA